MKLCRITLITYVKKLFIIMHSKPYKKMNTFFS